MLPRDGGSTRDSQVPVLVSRKALRLGVGSPHCVAGLALWFLAILASAAVFLPKRMAAFQISILLLTLLLMWVCYKTGESPSWRWGDRK